MICIYFYLHNGNNILIIKLLIYTYNYITLKLFNNNCIKLIYYVVNRFTFGTYCKLCIDFNTNYVSIINLNGNYLFNKNIVYTSYYSHFYSKIYGYIMYFYCIDI